jgi:bifunctional polynucleotide phosphatase/kinase
VFDAEYVQPFLSFIPFLSRMYAYFPSTQQLSTAKRIFLLDVDGTLIVSKSGRKWADTPTDWMWAHPHFPQFLAEKSKDAVVALVTNQSMWTHESSQAPAKIQSILAALEATNGWRPACLVATKTTKQKDTLYRKPGRGLYDVLLKELGWRQEDVGSLEMCGDAVGAEDPNQAYRWADSDSKFAQAIGATFIRPCDLPLPTIPPPSPSTRRELVICVGNPGSGKSTTARRFAAAGYTHVEQDVTKTPAATMKAVKAAITTQSVVVDATHSSVKNRAPYIALAKELAYHIRILWHVKDGRPWNALRCAPQKPVPEIAYAVYSKYFEEPMETEGLVDIVY